MSADNSCGEPPMWDHTALQGLESPPYGEQQAIDQDKMEITRLNHEIMKMRVELQTIELDKLTEAHFRHDHPAVQDAWDQYQTVRRLATHG